MARRWIRFIVRCNSSATSTESNPMLELTDVSLSAPRRSDEADAWLLREVSARIPTGHLCAILGPSGCGKSTLLKVIAGLAEPNDGAVLWQGRDLATEQDFEPHEIGYVPQFSIAYELLTVFENVDAALRLRVGNMDAEERHRRAVQILANTGLSEIAERQVKVLSGGQKRRLALALELSSSPVLLLCDEVTSGLDAKAEDEIVHLLRDLSRQSQRTVLSVTHSLRHLDLHDSVALLSEGHLVYHGPPQLLAHYFSIENLEELFPRLASRTGAEWNASWKKHGAAYRGDLENQPQASEGFQPKPQNAVHGEGSKIKTRPITLPSPEFQRPSFFTQFFVLLARRFRLLVRDRGQLGLQLALIFGFPCLVVIFAWDGLPQIQNLTSTPSANPIQQVLEDASFTLHSARIAGLISGLVMFQVILLTLMGSNNGAREIAGERAIFEKEKFAGLRPASYIASKAVFLAAIVTAQSVWMAAFVNVICRFPGDLGTQIGILLFVNGAMTAVCLGLSSIAKSADQASLVCVYWVGFQLPLSGAVLALPHVIGWLTRPFIAAFWGWSGYLQTMRDTRFYDVVQSTTQTELVALVLCFWVLGSHILGGLLLAYLGAKSSRWQ
jgi:ABC-type multidrug transport system ATPase subunit